jgi:hypothetical protein
LGCPRKIVCGVHERDVRERLGTVAHQSLCPCIELLGKQTDIVPQSEQMLEEPPRVVFALQQDVRVSEPEAACQKHPFAPGRPSSILRVS